MICFFLSWLQSSQWTALANTIEICETLDAKSVCVMLFPSVFKKGGAQVYCLVSAVYCGLVALALS